VDHVDPFPTSLSHILAEITRLDVLLRIQIARMRDRSGPAEESLSAFYIPDAEIDSLLDKPIGTPLWANPVGDDLRAAHRLLEQHDAEITARLIATAQTDVFLRLPALATMFDLSTFDVDIVLLCLAVEIDRRYGRFFAYLHDDVTRRLPTIDLILTLLCPDIHAKLGIGRSRFIKPAALARHRLVAVEEEAGQQALSMLGGNVRLDPRVAGFLLENDEPDDRISSYVSVVDPTTHLDDLLFPAELRSRLIQLAALRPEEPIMYFQGPYGVGKQAAAEACCMSWGTALLVVHGARLVGKSAEEFTALVDLIKREARLLGAALFWEGFDDLLTGDRRVNLEQLLVVLDEHAGPSFLAGETIWERRYKADGRPLVRVMFPVPDQNDQSRLWRMVLQRQGISVPDLTGLAASFRLSGGQIVDAAATAYSLAIARDPQDPAVTEADLYQAGRLQSNRRLTALAQYIAPRLDWDDIVLPSEQMEQLREIRAEIRFHSLVFEQWGFAGKLARGTGLTALFVGPSGTGKTMAADVIAHTLGIDLYKIDLSSVVSKYIGETEKNLASIFTEAESSNALLFFDEADALFGKRTQVRDSHDRYANIETSFLLQKLEEHQGAVILATNLRKNMDDAFVRRIAHVVDFPIPSGDQRLRIWTGIWPSEAPRAPDLDLELLAQRIDLPGGNIRNIALAAAFLAATDGTAIAMTHLARAAHREYQKLGKIRTEVGWSWASGPRAEDNQ
jgi:SpoVK/Ycf46/Vps4 family AAA+-type ATPase